MKSVQIKLSNLGMETRVVCGWCGAIFDISKQCCSNSGHEISDIASMKL